MWTLLALAFGAPTLAVADLTNGTGQERLDPAGPGAAAILVTKFTSIDAVDVVERSRLEAVLAEINLSQTGVVDPAHAIEAGRLLGADFLVFGSIIGFQGDAITVHLQIVDTKTSAVLVADDVAGTLGADGSGFFQLVNALGDRIVAALQVELSPEEERAFQTARMREVEALLQYGDANQQARFEKLEAALARCGAGDADPRSKGAHRGVLAARVSGRIDSETFASCVLQVDAALEEEPRADFWLWMLKTAVKQIDAPVGFELIHQVATRPTEIAFAARPLKRARKQLGRSKAPAATELLDALSLDDGMLGGVPVDSAQIANADPMKLEWFARRLPGAAQRRAAAENLVRVRVASSPFSIVRARADVVVRDVLAKGYWAVPPELGIASATWEPSVTKATLTVKAKPLRASARVQLDGADGLVSSTVSLGPLRVRVDGLEQDVSLCLAPRAFDPTPCLERSRLVLDDTRLVLADEGIAIPTRLPIDDLVELIRDGDALIPNLRVDGVAVAGLSIPIVFKPVPSLIMGGSNGSRGPDLTVDLYSIRHGRVLVGVRGPNNAWASAAVVPYGDPKFTAGSQGGRGIPGRDGQDGDPGTEGLPGFPGTCETNGGEGQDGGDGGPGGPGENGGPGGDGGDVLVVLHCEEDCPELERFARERMKSFAGSGGNAGSGGSGGPAGAGGDGGERGSCQVTDDNGYTRTHTTFGGSDGSRGSTGPMGDRGSSGPDGSPGRVEIQRAN